MCVNIGASLSTSYGPIPWAFMTSHLLKKHLDTPQMPTRKWSSAWADTQSNKPSSKPHAKCLHFIVTSQDLATFIHSLLIVISVPDPLHILRRNYARSKGYAGTHFHLEDERKRNWCSEFELHAFIKY